MKYTHDDGTIVVEKSLPVRGAWVEIPTCPVRCPPDSGRSPCGERGLKYHHLGVHHVGGASLPVRGAWVEIAETQPGGLILRVAPRAGSVG